jgi:hypothetical protein
VCQLQRFLPVRCEANRLPARQHGGLGLRPTPACALGLRLPRGARAHRARAVRRRDVAVYKLKLKANFETIIHSHFSFNWLKPCGFKLWVNCIQQLYSAPHREARREERGGIIVERGGGGGIGD